jgi:hypothetical protein
MVMEKDQVEEQTGGSFVFVAKVVQSENAQFVNLAQEIVPTVEDHMIQGTVPIRHMNTHMAVEDREIIMNSGNEQQIVDLIKERTTDAKISMADRMEVAGWSHPASSTALQAYGVPSWLVKDSSEGFNGGNPSGFSSGIAGINADTYPGWKNYTFSFNAVTRQDFVRKLKTGMYKTDWRTPVAFPNPSGNTGGVKDRGIRNSMEHFTTFNNTNQLEELCESRNDNLGNDLSRFSGQVTIQRTIIYAVPYLDAADSTDPIYSIDWRPWKIIFLRGENMKQTGPYRHPTQPRTNITHWDSSYQLVCRDRRKQSVGYKV